MVITVTLNPALDRTLTLSDFTLGAVNRVETVREDIGGKGINVSKVLQEFGIDSTAMGFLGGRLEEVFREELKRRGIGDAFTPIAGSTRTNIKVVDDKNGVYTDINEPGAAVSEGELSAFLKRYGETLVTGDVVVLSGGLCPGVPRDIYRTLVEMARRKGAFAIVDAEGPALEEALKGIPFAVKPNDYELGLLEGSPLETEEAVVAAAKKLRGMGIEQVLVSLGARGSLLLTEAGILRGKGLKVPVKSTVGAGDSMVAALVQAKLTHLDPRATLALAQSSGAASVMLEGTKACTPEQVDDLLEMAHALIEEVKE